MRPSWLLHKSVCIQGRAAGILKTPLRPLARPTLCPKTQHLSPAYLSRYYLEGPGPQPPGGPAPPMPGAKGSWGELEAQCAANPLFKRFTSPSFNVRAFSAAAILFNVSPCACGRPPARHCLPGLS
jgi:hypothetical protein